MHHPSFNPNPTNSYHRSILSWKHVERLQLETLFQLGSVDDRRFVVDDLPGPRRQPPRNWQLQHGRGDEAGRITGESEKFNSSVQ